MILIDGKKESESIKEELKSIIEKNNLNPKIIVIQIGNDERSNIYIKNKERACHKIGISFELKKYSLETNEEQILNDISVFNEDTNVHGIILQLPIPKSFDQNKIINSISYKKDVDGLTNINLGKLMSNEKCFTSCTPTGIIHLLKKYNIPIEGKHVVIIGRSLLVGKPLALLLLKNNATVTICHSKTNNLKNITKEADILISATGEKHLIKEDMVKKDSTIIDVGIISENGKVYGDVDFESVKNNIKYITPVPGGIGPMTIAILLKHVVEGSMML